MKKVPKALVSLYRIALKKGVKLESFMDGDCLNIWTRKEPGRPYERFWIELRPDGHVEVIEQENNKIIINSPGISLGNPNPNQKLYVYKNNRPFVPVPNEPFKMPEEIKDIYRRVLKGKCLLVCEVLDWMFPIGYKIKVYNREVLNYIETFAESEFYNVNGNVDDYEEVSYILQPGKITKCPK